MGKLIKTKRNKRSGGCILQIFIKSTLKYNEKKVSIFHFILVGIQSILILSIKNRGRGWFFLLNIQNLLSMTKVICWQSYKLWQDCLHDIWLTKKIFNQSRDQSFPKTPQYGVYKTDLKNWKIHLSSYFSEHRYLSENEIIFGVQLCICI